MEYNFVLRNFQNEPVNISKLIVDDTRFTECVIGCLNSVFNSCELWKKKIMNETLVVGDSNGEQKLFIHVSYDTEHNALIAKTTFV